MTAIPRPKTKADLAKAKKALNELLEKEFDGVKNKMARELGFSRNSISWWFSKGYIGSQAVSVVAEKTGWSVQDLRPDFDEEKVAAEREKRRQKNEAQRAKNRKARAKAKKEKA